MNKTALLAALSPLALSFPSCDQVNNKTSDHEKPNIIFIYADDLGYGDVGCFGATDIETPHLDRMSAEGIQFNSFYSASPICSPSRAALLTGRYPVRMGIHGVFFPESHTGMPTDETTIPEVMKKGGYTTGMIGKWHLGHLERFMPLQRGFDDFFGVPYSNDMAGYYYYRGNEIESYEVDQSLITQKLTLEAVDFIDRNKEDPFFLYLAHPMPHVPIYASEQFLGTSERGIYGDVIQELDWSVGQVLQKLGEENLLENTMVIFSSDNGPWRVMRHMGGLAGGLREGKFFTFEGGMRVPTLAMWKGTIPAGTKYEDMAMMMDWLPTFASIAGIDHQIDKPLDGEDITPILLGETKQKARDLLYYDFGIPQAFRSGKWKVKRAYEGFEGRTWKKAVAPHPVALFDLEEDPGETKNLADSNPEKLTQMLAKMEQAIADLGELPPEIPNQTPADVDFYNELRETYGEEFYIFENDQQYVIPE